MRSGEMSAIDTNNGPFKDHSHPGRNAIKITDTSEFKSLTQKAFFLYVALEVIG